VTKRKVGQLKVFFFRAGSVQMYRDVVCPETGADEIDRKGRYLNEGSIFTKILFIMK